MWPLLHAPPETKPQPSYAEACLSFFTTPNKPDTPKNTTYTMKTTLFLAAAFAGLVAADELKIDVTHKVECTRKTQKGDAVSMHYRGTLQADGSQFDASTFLYFIFLCPVCLAQSICAPCTLQLASAATTPPCLAPQQRLPC